MRAGYYGCTENCRTGVIFNAPASLPRVRPVTGVLLDACDLSHGKIRNVPYGHNDVVHYAIPPIPVSMHVASDKRKKLIPHGIDTMLLDSVYDTRRYCCITKPNKYSRTARPTQEFVYIYGAYRKGDTYPWETLLYSFCYTLDNKNRVCYNTYSITSQLPTDITKRPYSYNTYILWKVDDFSVIVDCMKEWIDESTSFGFYSCTEYGNEDIYIGSSAPFHCSSLSRYIEGKLSNKDFSTPAAKAARQAYDALPTFGSNGISLSKDVVNLSNDIERSKSQLSELGIHLSNSRNLTKDKGARNFLEHYLLKDLSNIFLSVKYGLRLTLADLSDLRTEIFRDYKPIQTVTAVVPAPYGTLRYTQYYQPFANCSKIEEILVRGDLLPDLSNLWDLIPYSFVVDWFLNIGDIAASIDNYITMENRHIPLEYCITKNLSIPIPSGIADLPEDTVCTYYSRSYGSGCRIPEFPIGLQDNSFSHWLEAGSLYFASK